MTYSPARLLGVIAVIVAVAAALLFATPADAQTGQVCVDDDVNDSSSAELTRACATLTNGTVSFQAFFGDPPRSSADIVFAIDTDSNDARDYTGSSIGSSFRWRNGSSTSSSGTRPGGSCPTDVPAQSTGDIYQTDGLPLSCFEGNTQMRFHVIIGSSGDRAPDFGWSPFLSLTGGAVDPDPAPAPDPGPAPSGEVGRLSGPSRIETSIAISQFQFPSGSRDVYLSRSDEFADSISSGSLTNGPVLLVPQCGPVPQAVLAEVQRLSPDNVYALGGAAAVCDQVLNDVAAVR